MIAVEAIGTLSQQWHRIQAEALAIEGNANGETSADALESPEPSKQLRNQFNFTERCTQVWRPEGLSHSLGST